MNTERFHELSEDVIDYFVELEKKLSLPIDMKFV